MELEHTTTGNLPDFHFRAEHYSRKHTLHAIFSGYSSDIGTCTLPLEPDFLRMILGMTIFCWALLSHTFAGKAHSTGSTDGGGSREKPRRRRSTPKECSAAVYLVAIEDLYGDVGIKLQFALGVSLLHEPMNFLCMYDGPILFSGELSGGADIYTTRLQRYASEKGRGCSSRNLAHTAFC